MSDKPMVSVIMPCRNAVKYIRVAVDSFLEQTYENCELIVVDNSDDGTREILDEYAQRFCFTRGKLYAAGGNVCVLHQNRPGRYDAGMNQALEVAKGEYIARVCADDAMLPDKLTAQVMEIRSAKADIVTCGSCYIDAAGVPVNAQGHDSPQVLTPMNLEQYANGIQDGTPVSDTTLAPREIYDRIGPFQPNDEACDAWWNFQAIRLGLTWAHVPAVHYLYRVHAESWSATGGGANHYRYLDLVREYQNARLGNPAASGELSGVEAPEAVRT